MKLPKWLSFYLTSCLASHPLNSVDLSPPKARAEMGEQTAEFQTYLNSKTCTYACQPLFFLIRYNTLHLGNKVRIPPVALESESSETLGFTLM